MKDWYGIEAWKGKDRVPDSCCVAHSTNKTDCGVDTSPENVYQKGCFDKIHMWVIEQLHLVGITVLIFAFIQVLTPLPQTQIL